MAEELLLLSPAQIEAAANVGRLARLAERLVEERSWSSVDMLLAHASLDVVPLDELAAAARAIDRALARMPEARSRRASIQKEISTLRAMAGAALAKRLRHDPLAADERDLLALAAELLLAAGDPREAARLFERSGEDLRAADAYGATGDLERMEACHQRIDERRGATRAVSELSRKVEGLIESGDRLAALLLLEAAPQPLLEASGMNTTRTDLAVRLRRGRGITLKVQHPEPRTLRFAGAPAVLGRDPACELPLRDPGVSRRHAVIVADGGRMVVEDAGSKAGTTMAGARLMGRVPLGHDMEISLGRLCRLTVTCNRPGLVRLEGQTGLDRAFKAIVAEGSVDLAEVFDGGAGVSLNLDGGVARLERLASQLVRVSGRFIGRSCDLLLGDTIEILGENEAMTLEVVA